MVTVRQTSVLMSCLLFWGSVCLAETTTKPVSPSCPDANVLSSKLITDIDWSTVDVRIAGVMLTGGDVPEGAASAAMGCACQDKNGVYRPGLKLATRSPIQLYEVVRTANCSPALGGVNFQPDTRLIGGPQSKAGDSTDNVFYNVNVWALPLFAMLDLFTSVTCGNTGFMDMDMISTSTADPTWNDDELSLLFSPEAFICSTPLTIAMDLADGIASTAGRPINKAICSAGTWGHIYPMTGNVITVGSPPQDTSLIATKALAKLHRIGFEKRTMGEDVICKAKYAPTIFKSQYRFSTFFPIPEISGEFAKGQENSRVLKGSHVIGASTFTWGEWRNRPGSGEDFLYLLWRWTDCCASKEGT